MKYLLDTDHLSILQRQAGQDYIEPTRNGEADNDRTRPSDQQFTWVDFGKLSSQFGRNADVQLRTVGE
jgi:hypothetical protein